MSNRIRRVELMDKTLVPAEAEVWVMLHLDHLTPTTEVRGRLMGPTCRYASTVEVAYALRPLPKSQKPPASEGPARTLRVVIPEPSLWDPISPFLYHGPVELWEDGTRVEQITIRHGLCSKTLNTHGLRWNGRPLTLRSRDVLTGSEDEMLALRAAGYNLLTAPLGDMELWERADRIGFLVLGRVRTPDEAVPAELTGHPSCLGFLFDADVWSQVDRSQRKGFKSRGFSGVELHALPMESLPADLDFVACDAERCEEMSELGLPVIALGDAAEKRL